MVPQMVNGVWAEVTIVPDTSKRIIDTKPIMAGIILKVKDVFQSNNRTVGSENNDVGLR